MKSKSEAGFTVIEVVVSLLIGTFVILSLTILITTLAVANDRAKDLTYANALAENKLESLRSVGYSSLANGTTDFNSELPDTLASPRTGSYTVSDVATGLKRIDLTITYNDRGSTKTLNYSTYIGQLGVAQ